MSLNSRGSEKGVPTSPSAGRNALWLTIVLIGVYAALDVIAQLLPPHYSAITQAESDLAVGPYGWVMTVNFVVRGVLSLGFLYGLTTLTRLGRQSPAGIALVGGWGIGAFILAATPTDVGSGAPTLHGTIHLIVAALAFLLGALGELALSRNFRSDERLVNSQNGATAISVLALVFCFLTFAATGSPRLVHGAFGLVERIFIGLVLLWMLLVSIVLLRHAPSPPPPVHRTAEL